MRLLKQLKAKMNPALTPLFTVMLFDHISVNITFPVLTFVFFSPLSSLFQSTTSLAERTLWYGVVIAIAHVGGVISAPIISSLSDALGRKPMLFIASMAAFVFGITCTVGILYASLVFLVIGKLVGGLLSRTNPVALAVIGDISEPENKVVNMAYLQVVISIGAFIGPVIGGYFAKRFFFQSINFALPYILASAFSAMAGVCALFFFKETLKEKQKVKESLLACISLLFNKRITKISLLLCVTQVAWSSFYQFLPPILKTQFHFSPSLLGLYIGMIALWLTIGSAFLVKFLKRRLTLHSITTVSVALMLLGNALTVIAVLFRHEPAALWLLWISAIPMAMGDVVVYSVIVTLYSNAVGAKKQGAIMGFCFIIVSLVWSATALVGGLIGALHIALPMYFALVVIGVVFFWQIRMKRWIQ
jgi:MFS transporter, DHA1 family, tetracycline resistance protein